MTHERMWVNPYIDYSDKIHADQVLQFRSDEWKNLLLQARDR